MEGLLPNPYPNIPATPRSTVSAAPRLKFLEYGDGYQQVARDGINALDREMTLVHEYLDSVVAGTLRAFLTANYGQVVTCPTVGDNITRNWLLREWSEQFDGNTSFQFQVKLIETH
ncbi:hypothetical protein Sp245p_28935 (plasmid) [Azospirillum baldaniorum]|uniref:Minor tail protein n=1 Tax=Azospirillum baldaniorum TaxID=1064539 RepID=A0A9P1JY43_9PROT|nr:hypothetical protein Sp245p_28935 [Azospirillum baldaniorum]TWA81672.1 minor tail protein [Azospirillum brasilense]CCD02008.1 protein of unknown function [Azospirillum baldaniorum]